MDDNLLGYLLNSLEPDEHRQVEDYLRTHPEAAAKLERLRQTLAPLSAVPDPPPPSPRLVLGTFALIAEMNCRPPLPPLPPPVPKEPTTPEWRWLLRRADVLLVASLLLVFAGLVTTWILRARQEEQRVNCQNNLHRWWQSLEQYSDGHAKRFPAVDPAVEPKGSHGVAGFFVPLLNDAGLIAPDMSVGCSALGTQAPPTYSVRELEKMYQTNPFGYQTIAPSLSRDYAYTLGYNDQQGKLHGLRRDSGDLLPLMADRPPLGDGGNSPNHGGIGQNVLYIGGDVRWCTTRTVGVELDDIYLNKHNLLEAGDNRTDTVLAPSEAGPGGRRCAWHTPD